MLDAGVSRASVWAQFRQRYLDWSSSGEDTPPFHYGTHYSSAAAVSSYLIRCADDL